MDIPSPVPSILLVAQAVTWLTEAQYEGRMPCAMLLGEELEDMPVLNLAAHVRQLAGREFPIILVSDHLDSCNS